MEAKEMFEKWGFKPKQGDYTLCYYNEKEEKFIWFYLDEKQIEVYFDITMPLLKAINQQCKEFGWLDEE